MRIRSRSALLLALRQFAGAAGARRIGKRITCASIFIGLDTPKTRLAYSVPRG